MKTVFLVVFVLFAIPVFSQNIDSLAVVREVDSLLKTAQAHSGSRQYDKALELISAAEKIIFEKIGRQSAIYGDCCFDRGRVHYLKREYTQAEQWYLESKVVRETVLGKEHLDYANCLYNLANLYLALRRYNEAEPLYFETKRIYEAQSINPNSPNYTGCLTNLGILYEETGKYELAEPLYLRVKNADEKALATENPSYAGTLINLANLYCDMSRLDEAALLYLEAKAIFEDKLDNRNHPFYINCLNNLAILYRMRGDYEKAEPLYLEVIDLREKNLGKEHPAYASSLNNLGVLYQYMGIYKEAGSLLLEAKAIREKVFGKDDLDYASSLYNLGVLYQATENYPRADSFYLEALALLEKHLGKEHLGYTNCLNSQARLYQTAGNYLKAEQLYLEVLALIEKISGKESLDYANCLGNLAFLYSAMRRYNEAEPLYLETKKIYEANSVNPVNLYFLATLSGLAGLFENQNRYSASEPLLAELSRSEQARLASATSFLSERELAIYTATFQRHGDNLITSILARRRALAEGDRSDTLTALAYNHALFHKGFLLTSAVQMNAFTAAHPECKETNYRLKSFRSRLAAEYAKPIAERNNVAELEEKANAAEKELARTVAGYGDAIRQVRWQEVQSKLKQDEAAIEFVHFLATSPKNIDSLDTSGYAAMILRPGAGQPVFVPLFEEKQLDSLLAPGKEQRQEYLDEIYATASRGAKPLKQKELKGLYELIWKPLEKNLRKIKTVYYSPSGLLHRFNLAAIPLPAGKKSRKDQTLGDRYRLVQLGSTRQLVLPVIIKTMANNIALFGSITYDADATVLPAINSELSASHTRGGLSFSYTDSTLRTGTIWNYLPGTEREMRMVGDIARSAGITVQEFSGSAATEEALKSLGVIDSGALGSPRILHLATHGFFFPDPELNPQSVIRNPQFDEPVFKLSDHPMIRSGLILAGGNHAWATGKPIKPGLEDGILTAYEISQMNLSNTELVVLSACETGLGDIQGNEGVYGLQRAFKIAGAKYLIMSLWQVPDKQTSLLMTTFYKKWLEEKMTIPKAFRAAQKELREAGLDPYYWAGFVLVE